MKKFALALTAVSFLALGACDRGREDQLGNDVELNSAGPDENLNTLSDDAANVAAESEALENQAAALEQQVQDATTADNATGPETPADENIEGM